MIIHSIIKGSTMPNVLSFKTESEKIKTKQLDQAILDSTVCTDVRAVIVQALSAIAVNKINDIRNIEKSTTVVPYTAFATINTKRTPQLYFVAQPETVGYYLNLSVLFVEESSTNKLLQNVNSFNLAETDLLKKLIHMYQLQLIQSKPGWWIIRGKAGQEMRFLIDLDKLHCGVRCSIVVSLDVPVTNNPLDNLDHLFAMDLFSGIFEEVLSTLRS